MKDYAQYTSRIPSPLKRSPGKQEQAQESPTKQTYNSSPMISTTTTRHVVAHPLQQDNESMMLQPASGTSPPSYLRPFDKRTESDSTGSSTAAAPRSNESGIPSPRTMSTPQGVHSPLYSTPTKQTPQSSSPERVGASTKSRWMNARAANNSNGNTTTPKSKTTMTPSPRKFLSNNRFKSSPTTSSRGTPSPSNTRATPSPVSAAWKKAATTMNSTPSPNASRLSTTPSTSHSIASPTKGMVTPPNKPRSSPGMRSLLPTPRSSSKSPRKDHQQGSTPESNTSSAVPTTPISLPTTRPRKNSPTSSTTPASTSATNNENEIASLEVKLKEALERDVTAKTALAKSDAIVLELRSSVRQLKRQLETASDSHSVEQTKALQDQVSHYEKQIHELQTELSTSKSTTTPTTQTRSLHSRSPSNHQLDAQNETVGELEVQLDRAHAQILTADMVRKELEDTLEAEQYTWELRVQDQDRQVASLTQECDRLSHELQVCRQQWKDAEQTWHGTVQDLQAQLAAAKQQQQQQANSNAGSSVVDQDLIDKVQKLEDERSELQTCLDDALRELEAADLQLDTQREAEQVTSRGMGGGDTSRGIATNGGAAPSAEVVESLQHLYRWILQEGPSDRRVHNLSHDPVDLLRLIRVALEEWIVSNDETKNRNDSSLNSTLSTQKELEVQLARVQVEMQSREEASVELRTSLREATALLKPMQDARALVEEQNEALHRQVQTLQEQQKSRSSPSSPDNGQLELLQNQIKRLEAELLEARKQMTVSSPGMRSIGSPMNASRSMQQPSTPGTDDSSNSKIQRAREEMRKKRQTEGNLQQLLKDAQSRFHSLHQQNENQTAKNRELQGQLNRLSTTGPDGQPLSVEEELLHAQQLLQQKEAQIAQLQEQHQEPTHTSRGGFDTTVDEALNATKEQLMEKEKNEKMLNKSLKDALSLLKPLQVHLEEAEAEKLEISKELRNLRKRFRQLQMGDLASVAEYDNQSRSTAFGGQDVGIEIYKIKEELEETVRQLELENSQLHDALDDISEMDPAAAINNGSISKQGGGEAAHYRQRAVELNSRYEVTQNKLEDAHVENHALVKAIKQKEQQERQVAAEMSRLRSALQHSESELNNAKAIARSALVKVEELTMANVEQLSLSRENSIDNGQ